MREPDTPGGFNDSMAWRPASSSATGEDMTGRATGILVQYGSAGLLSGQAIDQLSIF